MRDDDHAKGFDNHNLEEQTEEFDVHLNDNGTC